jgi:hypothetical protein
MLVLLGRDKYAVTVSAVLFWLALRTKEYAIVAPVVFSIWWLAQPGRLGERMANAWRRLWPHYAIAIVYLVRYATFLPRLRAEAGPGTPYFVSLSPGTIAKSLAYYAALVFNIDPAPAWLTVPLILLLLCVLAYGILGRVPGLAFAASAFVLTVLPVSLLPNAHSPAYVYGPQIFLILLLCLLFEKAAAAVLPEPRQRWAAAICASGLLLVYAASIRGSMYFGNREHFAVNVRRACMRTAGAVTSALPDLQKGAHIYINHGREIPWILAIGNCDYLKMLRHQPALSCVLSKPEPELRELYNKDDGPKYFLNYQPDGSFTVEPQ